MQNKSSAMRRGCWFILLLLVLGPLSLPADEQKPAATEQAAQGRPSQDDTGTAEQKQPSTELFVPSEKLRADDAVAFPVDI